MAAILMASDTAQPRASAALILFAGLTHTYRENSKN